MEKTEMEKLIILLAKNNIDFRLYIQNIFDSLQIIVPDFNNRDGDIICHKYSCGGPDGLLEIMGFGLNDVLGYLTAEKAFKIISDYYKQKEGEN